MTKDEAISILKSKSMTSDDDNYCCDEIEEAFDMAIKSLEQIEKIMKIIKEFKGLTYQERDYGEFDCDYLIAIENVLENKPVKLPLFYSNRMEDCKE